ncbi:Oidioi.mRNA.OKI2018_I69.PAR.g9106.t1.cds [Oikopleura dioica]|uniref:Oidioi.mRNA.OKI2018_I69.PAR.g9106.t1.cds n=1 Tax=Oikopleura dioica TaxID=34765 RepID=A0ABN7RPF9_OIKDI|nr:Oidioi.mRNA.OKI2018_I69.PAR.g9106.t1.cds [Oikopleura dioica]
MTNDVSLSNISVSLNNTSTNDPNTTVATNTAADESTDYYFSSSDQFYLYIDCEIPPNFSEIIRNTSELICKRKPLKISLFAFDLVCAAYFQENEIYRGVPKSITTIFPQLFELMINPLKAVCIVFGQALGAYVPGQNPVNCGSNYFRPGAEWPLQSRLGGAQSGKTVRLCQNNYGKTHYYATLFNTDTNVPVYSAVKIRRNKYASTYPRPSSNWHYMCNGLCGTSTPSSTTSFYSNLSSVGSSNYGNCDHWQPQDNDYLGNNAAIGIDRGHLIPNALMNQNEDAAKSTFTLTNVSPQYSTFNQQAWNQLECMVRKFMEEEINNEDVWIIVGTYGKVGTMNGNDSSKNNVDIPEFYWHAFCYTGTG